MYNSFLNLLLQVITDISCKLISHKKVNNLFIQGHINQFIWKIMLS